MFTRKKDWITVREAAEQLRVGETTLRECIDAGYIEYGVMNYVMRISPRSLKRFAKSPKYQMIQARQRVNLQRLLKRLESGEIMEAIKSS